MKGEVFSNHSTFRTSSCFHLFGLGFHLPQNILQLCKDQWNTKARRRSVLCGPKALQQQQQQTFQLRDEQRLQRLFQKRNRLHLHSGMMIPVAGFYTFLFVCVIQTHKDIGNLCFTKNLKSGNIIFKKHMGMIPLLDLKIQFLQIFVKTCYTKVQNPQTSTGHTFFRLVMIKNVRFTDPPVVSQRPGRCTIAGGRKHWQQAGGTSANNASTIPSLELLVLLLFCVETPLLHDCSMAFFICKTGLQPHINNRMQIYLAHFGRACTVSHSLLRFSLFTSASFENTIGSSAVPTASLISALCAAQFQWNKQYHTCKVML